MQAVRCRKTRASHYSAKGRLPCRAAPILWNRLQARPKPLPPEPCGGTTSQHRVAASPNAGSPRVSDAVPMRTQGTPTARAPAPGATARQPWAATRHDPDPQMAAAIHRFQARHQHKPRSPGRQRRRQTRPSLRNAKGFHAAGQPHAGEQARWPASAHAPAPGATARQHLFAARHAAGSPGDCLSAA